MKAPLRETRGAGKSNRIHRYGLEGPSTGNECR